MKQPKMTVKESLESLFSEIVKLINLNSELEKRVKKLESNSQIRASQFTIDEVTHKPKSKLTEQLLAVAHKSRPIH